MRVQGARMGNGCISTEGFLDPVQTNEMSVRVASEPLVQMREGSGRASGLSDLQQVHPGRATTNHPDRP